MTIISKCKIWVLTGLSPLWRTYLRLRGVRCGRGVIIMGRPGLNRKRGSEVRLGNNVTLCSNAMANPVAEGGRCRLATVAPGAELILHDGVGLSSVVICAAIRVEIGEGTQVGGGAMILDTDFHPRGVNGDWLTDPAAVAEPVVIGKKCFIGARAIILKGVTLGDGAVVGAGAVVSRDVPAGMTVVGNPARSIREAARGGEGA